MLIQERLQGNWMSIKDEIQARWSQLTDDDFQEAEEHPERLLGLIQLKSGQSRELIEDELEQILDQAQTPRPADAARDYARQAGEAARHGYEQTTEKARRGYAGAESAVQRSPLESVAIACGAGLLAGLMLGLILRRNG